MRTEDALNAFVEETGGWVASQLEACTRCGICAEACHYYQATGIPEYAPVYKMELIRRGYEQRFTLGGKLKLALGVDKAITNDDLLQHSKLLFEACTVCNKCSMVCPMGIQLGPILHNVRTGLSAAEAVPEDLRTATKKQVDIGSPLGLDLDTWEERIEWVADEFEVDIPIDKKGADTLVVFTSIEMMKFPTNIGAVAKILNAAGINWTLSSKGREVVNFGFFEGDMELTKLFMQRVFDGVEELGVKRMIISECGHAFDAFRWTAKNIMDVPDGLEVTHIVKVVNDLVMSGKIKVKKGSFDNGTITFHDACKIQRRGSFIQEPRNLMNILAPNSFKEMSPNKEESQCCGGGGGVISIKEADENRFAAFRLKVDQLKKVKADSVAMVCSNCRLQFVDGVNHFNHQVKVKSLTEMVAEAMEEEE